ncbi:MAG: VWA domain-containing protein, partial [Planctomycetaceae bacterium]
MSSKNLPALVISVVMHLFVLAGLFMWRMSVEQKKPKLIVETVFTEEREQEEFTQEMSMDTAVSQNLAVTAGGAVTGQLGSSAANPMPTQNIEKSDALKEPTINVTQFSRVTFNGLGDVNMDLGEGEVSGETGARVEGYGAAMHRFTQELRRMMRKEQVLVVWIMDSTESLKDDRKEIAENLYKIYEELDIARDQATAKKEKFEALETVICGLGQSLVEVTKKPTSDLKEIKEAITKMPEDTSGTEMVFSCIEAVLEKYGKMARTTNRKLVVMVLTDEVGDDAVKLEETVDRAKLFKAPVYFLARESIFGYPMARLKWKHPDTGEDYWFDILRGPETAMPEALQYDGFGRRDDSFSAGFAPYPPARLVKESGGIYFMLQTKETNLIGVGSRLDRKFDDISMKQYQPDLVPVREYVADRDRSDFRKTIWQVILQLNPNLDKELNITWEYPMEVKGFETTARDNFKKAVRSLQLMNVAITKLDSIRKDRDTEPNPRWRGAYDLVYAQLLSYRVREFQYMLAVDNHVKTNPKPKKPTSNRWHRHLVPSMIEPNEQQIKAAGIDMKELEEHRKKAVAAFDAIIKDHPNTPWAQVAAQEKKWGFGVGFYEWFRDPRRDDPKVAA